MAGKCGFTTRAALWAPMLLAALACPSWGQSSFLSPINPLSGQRRGIHLYSASAYMVYTSLALPPQQDFNFLTSPLPSRLSGDGAAGGAVAMGWNYGRERINFSLNYSASYHALFRNSN